MQISRGTRHNVQRSYRWRDNSPMNAEILSTTDWKTTPADHILTNSSLPMAPKQQKRALGIDDQRLSVTVPLGDRPKSRISPRARIRECLLGAWTQAQATHWLSCMSQPNYVRIGVEGTSPTRFYIGSAAFTYQSDVCIKRHLLNTSHHYSSISDCLHTVLVAQTYTTTIVAYFNYARRFSYFFMQNGIYVRNLLFVRTNESTEPRSE